MPIGTAKVGTVSTKASGTTHNVAYPSGLAADDYALVGLGINSAVEPSAPATWTQIAVFDTGSNTTPVLAVYGKKLAGTESGNLACATANVSSVGVMVAYPGVDPTTPLDVAWNATTMKFERTGSTTFTIPIPGDTTVTDGAHVVSFAAHNATGGSWTSDVGTELVDNAATTPRLHVGEFEVVTAGGSTAITHTGSTQARGLGIQVILRPAPPAASGFTGWGIPI